MTLKVTFGSSQKNPRRGIARTVLIVVVAAIIVVAGVLVYVVYNQNSTPPATTVSPLVVGFINPQSGSLAPVASSIYQGFQVWLNQSSAQTKGIYNSALNEYIPIKVISLDDHSDTSLDSSLAQQLVTTNNASVLVAMQANQAVVELPVADQFNKLILTGSDLGYANKFNYTGLIEVAPAFGSESDTAISVMKNMSGLHNIAVLYTNVAFATYIGTALVSKLKAAGFNVVYSQVAASATTDWTPFINQIKSANPDGLFFISTSPSAPVFWNQMKTLNVSLKFNYLYYSTNDPTTWTKSAGSTPGVFGVAIWTPVDFPTTAGYNNSAFVKVYNSVYKLAPAPISALGYNAGVVLGQTVAGAKSLTTQGMKNSALQLSGKMVTLFGPFSVAQNGLQQGLKYILAQYQTVNGQTSIVRIAPAPGAKPIYPFPGFS